MSYVRGSFGTYCMESTETSQAQREQIICEGHKENRAIVETAEHQNTEVTTSEAVSLLMNMRADHNHN